MMHTFTYRKALPHEMPELLDLANYVFSNAHVPHDFAALLPKVYAHDAPYEEAEQFVAVRDDGRIRALVALRHMTLTTPHGSLHIGFVGTVSVHPYDRGEGHMKHLMRTMREAAMAQGVDILVLGGQRQRYQYFGFENAGYRMRFRVTKTNVRHALRDADASAITFADFDSATDGQKAAAAALHERKAVRIERDSSRFGVILHSWHSDASVVLDGGRMIGYTAGDGMEITLEDDAQLLRVIKAMMAERKLDELTIEVQPWDHARIDILASLAEGWVLTSPDMVSVLDWAHVLPVLMNLRGMVTPLLDGRCVLDIDGKRYLMAAEGGQVQAGMTDEPASLTLTNMEAQQLLFGLHGITRLHPQLMNWLPLPMDVPATDGF